VNRAWRFVAMVLAEGCASGAPVEVPRARSLDTAIIVHPAAPAAPHASISSEPTSGASGDADPPRAPVEATDCVDPEVDALARARARWQDLGTTEGATVDEIGDLDGDGTSDVVAAIPSTCGNHTGCQPYYVYLRGPTRHGRVCDRFVGAFDGTEPTVLPKRSGGLHDISTVMPGLYGEVETRLSFDGSGYKKTSERHRDCPDGCSRGPEPWSAWRSFRPGLSGEDLR